MKIENSPHETYCINTDIIIDVLKIILHSDLKYEITDIKENKSQVVFLISIPENSRYQQEAMKNIADISNKYEAYRSYENENINWREE